MNEVDFTDKTVFDDIKEYPIEYLGLRIQGHIIILLDTTFKQ